MEVSKRSRWSGGKGQGLTLFEEMEVLDGGHMCGYK